jgi:hypothetical protein
MFAAKSTQPLHSLIDSCLSRAQVSNRAYSSALTLVPIERVRDGLFVQTPPKKPTLDCLARPACPLQSTSYVMVTQFGLAPYLSGVSLSEQTGSRTVTSGYRTATFQG